MAITGAYKFFTKSYLDIDFESVSITATSNAPFITKIQDRKPYTRWISSGTDDTTTEEIIVDFGVERTIDRLHLIDHNWKEFNIQYWNGSIYTDFSTAISETVNADKTTYFEFNSVDTQLIRLQAIKSQVVDAEKYLYQLLATAELGTFVGYPTFTPNFQVKRASKELVSGRKKYSNFDQAAFFTLTFNRYPPANDHSILLSLFENRQEFYFWPCGGDETQFRFALNGTRLEDIYLCVIDGQYSPWFDNNVYNLSPNASVRLTEVG